MPDACSWFLQEAYQQGFASAYSFELLHGTRYTFERTLIALGTFDNAIGECFELINRNCSREID